MVEIDSVRFLDHKVSVSGPRFLAPTSKCAVCPCLQMVDARRNTMTRGFILVPADEAVRPAEECALYYLHRSARSRGYKLEREREESSQVPCVLGLIE